MAHAAGAPLEYQTDLHITLNDKPMRFLVIRLKRLFCGALYHAVADIFYAEKPPVETLWGYLVVITVVINTPVLTIFLLKFFFSSPPSEPIKGQRPVFM